MADCYIIVVEKIHGNADNRTKRQREMLLFESSKKNKKPEKRLKKGVDKREEVW